MYTYRSVLYALVKDNPWCIMGNDTLNNYFGILEWCYNKSDAETMLKHMNTFNQFEKLKINKF